MKNKKLEIPVYSIDKFNLKPETPIQFQVENFHIHRNFKVSYPHRHDDFYEILYLTKGNGSYTIDSKKYEIKPNSIFFVSPGQIHELDLSADIKGYIFLFTSYFYHFNKSNPYKLFELPFFYNLNSQTPPLFLEIAEKQENFSNLFKKAIYENLENLADCEEVIRAILDLILIECKRLYPAENEIDKTQKGKILVKRFKKLIEEKCIENLSIKQYAGLLQISPNYLSETVKATTGRTSTDLINDRMLLEIKQMLSHTDKIISEIAYQLNFADQSYFSKYFKKLAGVSPGEWRNFV